MNNIFNLLALTVKIIFLTSLLCLTGCGAINNNIYCKQEIQKLVKSSDIAVVHTQEELIADVNEDGMTYILGAVPDMIITTIRCNATENLIYPIKERLQTFEMDRKINERILGTIKNAPWLHVKNTKVKFENPYNTLESMRTESESDVIGILTPYYKLDESLSKLEVGLTLELYAQSDTLRKATSSKSKKIKPIHRIKLSSSQQLKNSSNIFLKKNAKQWLERDGAEIKDALHHCLDDLNLMLKSHFISMKDKGSWL